MLDRLASVSTMSTQTRALWASMLGMLLDGYDLSIMAIALLPLRQQWALQAGNIGLLMAMALIGSLVGGFIGGVFIDHFGRRKLLFPNILLYIAGALTSAFSPTLSVLLIGRFITGLAVGLDYPLVATIIAEYSSPENRGNHFAWVNMAWYLGALLSTIVGWGLLASGNVSWHIMLGSAIIPALALLWVRRNLPESPRWLVRQGRLPEARTTLTRLYPTATPQSLSEKLKAYGGQPRSWPELLHPAWLKRLFLSIFPWFCLDVVALGIALYFPLVLRNLGMAGNDAQAAAINGVYLVVSALAIAFILKRIDRWGRIPLQSLGFALIALGLSLFATFALLGIAGGVYVGAGLYAIGIGIGPGVTAFALAVELFPTELRASAGGLATSFSRFGAVISAILFPILEHLWGVPLILFLMSAVALAGMLVTRVYAVESARKSLESLELPTTKI